MSDALENYIGTVSIGEETIMNLRFTEESMAWMEVKMNWLTW